MAGQDQPRQPPRATAGPRPAPPSSPIGLCPGYVVAFVRPRSISPSLDYSLMCCIARSCSIPCFRCVRLLIGHSCIFRPPSISPSWGFLLVLMDCSAVSNLLSVEVSHWPPCIVQPRSTYCSWGSSRCIAWPCSVSRSLWLFTGLAPFAGLLTVRGKWNGRVQFLVRDL